MDVQGLLRLDADLERFVEDIFRVLTSYLEHYYSGRPHRGVGLDVRVPAVVGTVTKLPVVDRVERVDVLAGLIHEYRRAA